MQIAPHTPARCASCFIQKLHLTHVDFESAFDGPYIPGAPPVSIDDLIVCEECLETAAKLIGLTREDELEARIAELEAVVAATTERAGKAELAVAALRAAVAAVEVVAPAEVPVEAPADVELERLRSDARELGIAVDGRWGAPRLTQEIEAATAPAEARSDA